MNTYHFPTIQQLGYRLFSYSLVFIFTIFYANSFAQGDKGNITDWYLVNTPYGISSTNKTYDINWDVEHIDERGGKITAKLWQKNKPDCSSFADFTWTFSEDISRVLQDQVFKITIGVKVKPGNPCSAPNDPTISSSIMAGVKWDESIGGKLSLAGLDLFKFYAKDQMHKKVTGNGVEEVIYVVKDRTGIGVDRDAQDGGFFVELFWRGNRFDIFYKYATAPLGTTTLGGTWTGNWHNNTFGTNGSCQFTFTQNQLGTVNANGNEGFGSMTGVKSGEAFFLHTSAANDYEYWAVITFSDPNHITLRYVGYGHAGRRKGESWTGNVSLTRK